MFDNFLALWGLTPDGDPIITRNSRLLPVRKNGVPAMLKIAGVAEEESGNALMVWWNGDGAASVLAHDGAALLLERAGETRSLVAMAQSGQDDQATCILCESVARLHSPRNKPTPPLVPLKEWFRELQPVTDIHGGILRCSADTARKLLEDPQDVVALHGDIHHGNVLDFGARGWLAIDPKGLHGERGFDYANLFTNPDFDTATAPGRVGQLANIVAQMAGIERERVLRWVLAWSGLSAAWHISKGDAADLPLTVAEIAASECSVAS
ncbi:MAG: 3'-kinase [Armatimonadetes bacterium]|nr:3'-kinase [Armatimonadota bacterium]